MGQQSLGYQAYVLRWVAAWMLVTLTSELSKIYDISISIGDAAARGATCAIIELYAGLFWASTSWLLFRMLLKVFKLEKDLETKSLLVVVLAMSIGECLAFGYPLGSLDIDVMHHPFHEDGGAIESNTSLLLEACGILSAFPIACLVAGYAAVSARGK